MTKIGKPAAKKTTSGTPVKARARLEGKSAEVKSAEVMGVVISKPTRSCGRTAGTARA